MIAEIVNVASGLSDTYRVVGDFSAPGVCGQAFSAPFDSIQQESWTQLLNDSTKNYKVLGLVFTLDLTQIQTSTGTVHLNVAIRQLAIHSHCLV